MGADRRSFQELYRANQAQVEAERAREPRSSTIPLLEPAEEDPSLFDFSAELSAPESGPADPAATGGSLFDRGTGDLGGLADPNQSKTTNPYDSQARWDRS